MARRLARANGGGLLPFVMVVWAALAPLVASLLLARAASAGADAFTADCLTGAADPISLARRLDEAGYREVDPNEGPRGPFAAQAAGGRRLWSRPGPPEAYVGFTAPGPGQPLAVCWQILRPDESPAASLATLKRRFPAFGGTSETGLAVFYGGYERWTAHVNGTEITLGVEWSMRDRPDVGIAILYAVWPAR